MMIARSGWFGDYNDPTTFLDMFIKGHQQNDGDYDNPEYNRLMKEASQTLDPKKRMELLTQAETILCDIDVPALPF